MKRPILSLLAAAAVLLSPSTPLLAAADAQKAGAFDEAVTEQVTVRLVTDAARIEPGETFDVGFDFTLAEHWHVYWRNPGDSGEPPSVEWSLPDGFTAGPLQWPAPERIVTGTITNYGYSHRVLLPVRVEPPPALASDETARIAANLRWLACRAEECIPGEATLALDLPVGAGSDAKPARAAESGASTPARANDASTAFEQARRAIPRERPAVLLAGSQGRRATLELPGFRPRVGAEISFYPLEPGIVVDGSERVVKGRTPDDLRIELALGERAPARLERLQGVVVARAAAVGETGSRTGARAANRDATTAYREAVLVDARPAAPREEATLALAVMLAMAGGLLLNLMPCVFPVLSLKVLGFVEQAGADARRVRRHGWAFTLGVLASFWVLAALLLALRAGGESLGWGFQLQSPAFLAGLCVILLLLALSLSGVFEVGLSLTTVTGSRVDTSAGYAASFWTGALATVIATPCTAPFMGTALGYALTQPAHVSLTVFTALGAGMALPYLVLSYAPALLRRLPKPGAWMETFRQLMAFPLYATVLWLLYVFSRQTSDAAMWRLTVALLLAAMSAWTWGVAQRSRRRGRFVFLVLPAVAAAALAVGVSAVRQPEVARAGDTTTAARRDGTDVAGVARELWRPWSPERVEELRAADRPVFVNFTADWCLSCQVNEKVVFASDDVKELFTAHDVTALKADWTNEDPRIADTLASFGRDGVPLYVFYPAGGAPPRILPQVPTHGSLREAFAAGATPRQADTEKEKRES